VIIHASLSVRGALLNWSSASFKGVFANKDGRSMSAREAKAALLAELAKGREVLPFGSPCDGFDYVHGCPGHEEQKT